MRDLVPLGIGVVVAARLRPFGPLLGRVRDRYPKAARILRRPGLLRGVIFQAAVKLSIAAANVAGLIGDGERPLGEELSVLACGHVVDLTGLSRVHKENRMHGGRLNCERARVHEGKRNELQVVRGGLPLEAIYFTFPGDTVSPGLATESPGAILKRLDKVRLLGQPQSSPIFYDSVH